MDVLFAVQSHLKPPSNPEASSHSYPDPEPRAPAKRLRFSWKREKDGFLRPTGRAEDYTGGRIEQVDIDSGAVRILYDSCDGISLKGPNDIVFDTKGGFWFTDLGKSYGRLMDRGAVYYARADGSLIKEAIFPLVTPNGIGLSPDGLTLYVAETETGRVWNFPITGEGGHCKGTLAVTEWRPLLHGLPGYQRLDSLAVEENGNLCVATIMPGGVSVFSSEGQLIEFHEADDLYCTNICFGGPDMRTAFITLSGTGRLVAVDWPRPGLALNDRRSARKDRVQK